MKNKFAKHTLPFLLLGLTAGQAPLARAQSSAEVTLREKAHSLEARGRADLAAQVWQQLLAVSPQDPDALASLAQWARSRGQDAEYRKLLERLRQISPEAAGRVESRRREASGREGDSNKLAEAAKLASEHHFDEAMQIYRKAFGEEPPAGAWAVAYYETLAGTEGGLPSALAGLRKMAALHPGVPDYKLSIARLLTYQPSTRQEGVAELASLSSNPAIAGQTRAPWKQALLWEKSNPAYAASARSYLERFPDPEIEKLSVAIASIERPAVAPEQPGDKETRQGFVLLKQNSLPEAEEQFQKALQVNPHLGRAHAGLGFIAMKQSRFEDAISLFNEAGKGGDSAEVRSALHQAKFWMLMNAGAKASAAGDWNTAVAQYELAHKMDERNSDAANALAGALLASGKPGAALAYLNLASKRNGSDPETWVRFVKATREASGAAAAQSVIASMSPAVKQKLASSSDWQIQMAGIALATGDRSSALAQYQELLSLPIDNLTVDQNVELANLALQFEQPKQATIYAQHALEHSPASAAGWELLVSSLVASNDMKAAEDAYNRMPAAPKMQAENHVGFRQSLASLKVSNGDLPGARTLLESLISAPMPEDQRVNVKLQLADLQARLGNPEKAQAILTSLVSAHRDRADIWRARFSMLDQQHDSHTLLKLYADVPPSVAATLKSDGTIVSAVARANADAGSKEVAVNLLKGYLQEAAHSAVDGGAAQRVQIAWILLDMPSQSAELYRTLQDLEHDNALTAESRQQVNALWSTWILRSAEAARKAGNNARSLSILEAGSRTYPSNPNLQSAFAGNLLASGEPKRALAVYANWGLQDASESDFEGAIGAALAAHEFTYADTWLNSSLRQWPQQSKLLSLAGDLAQARGNSKQAQHYWKAALAAQQNTTPANTLATLGTDPTGHQSGSLRSFLVGDTPANSFLAPDAALGVAIPTPQDNALLDKIRSLASSNSPYLGSRFSLWNRSGEPGFGRLLIAESQIEASTTFGESLRASMILKPTVITGGRPTGSSEYMFGRQTEAGSFTEQSASGVGGEFQLASQYFGLRAGTTPAGFLTRDWIGGVRFSPGRHLTFLLDRDRIRDTMLSFAGARDPITGQIWGGVANNSAGMQSQWGSLTNGYYVSAAYQVLTGANVQRNTGMNASMGAWWKIISNSDGSLTVGTNLTGMHYDRNLRYFTFGQGGYFSPQQYVLFNVPVRWVGSRGPLQYMVAGSLGAQHFVERASSYYSTDASLERLTLNPRYAGMTSTGPNFSFEGKLSYQLAPHWSLGAFVGASNARDYTAASGGLFVRYTFEERPMSFVDSGNGLPDWRGQAINPF